MPIKSKEISWGAWAFLIGVVLAIMIGLTTSTVLSSRFQEINAYKSTIYGILVLIGLLIGFVNVTGSESKTFLLAGAVLIIASSSGMNSIQGSFIDIEIGEIVKSIFSALLALFVPATIVVALKTVFSIAKV